MTFSAMNKKMSERPHRKINTYVRREGRLTRGQREALEKLYPKHSLTLNDGGRLNLEDCFEGRGPVVIEVGFGSGEAIISNALNFPDHNFLGIEVFRSGVGQVLNQIEQAQLNNLKVLCHDALEVLESHIDAEAVDGIQVLFPDPWPKKRHHKRRMVNTKFLSLIAQKIKPGGYLFIATDEAGYTEHINEVLGSQSYFGTCPESEALDGPYFKRPSTRFERRGIRLGNAITEWRLQKI